MHNNSISFRTARFETALGEFRFYEGKAINFITSDCIIRMVGELAEIYRAICDSIGYEGLIADPYPQQVEPATP